METDQPGIILINKQNSENLIPVATGEGSIGESANFSREAGLPDGEEAPKETGSHCMTLACSAFRSIRQISDPSLSKKESSGNSIPDAPARQSRLPEISFGCRDLGFDCEFVVTATEAKIVLRKFIGHAETSHNLPVLPADLLLKMHQALKE